MRFRALILLPLFLVVGCAGYRLGPTNGLVAGAKSIQINPFVNQTLEPRLSEPVTLEVRKRVQQDGTYKLATQNDGDMIVNGVITTFARSGISYKPNDIATVSEYNLTVTARVTAVDRLSGKTNLNQLVRGRTVVRVGNDLSSAERQAIPLVAADLARNAVAAIADGTW